MSIYTDTNNGLHYDLQLDLQPENQMIHVLGSLVFHTPESGVERARFYLNPKLTVLKLSGHGVSGYQRLYDPEADVPNSPQISILDVYFDPPLNDHQSVLIEFEYQGTFSDWPVELPNTISKEWVELGRAMAWFPYQYDHGVSPFTFSLHVNAPEAYQVMSLGTFAKSNHTWYFYWPYPTTDILVFAGLSLQTQVFGGEKNHIIAGTLVSEQAKRSSSLGDEALWIIERFSGWFGPTRPTDFTVVETPRKLGGIYARRGLAVVNPLSPTASETQQIEQFHGLARAIAHTWWWEAPTTTLENWLNESFSEFSAMLAIREFFGEIHYNQILSDKLKNLAMSPLSGQALKNTPDLFQQDFLDRIYQNQGPILLHSLSQRIGYRRYFDFCRARLWSGVLDSAHLLDLLEEIEDTTTRQWLESQLKDYQS